MPSIASCMVQPCLVILCTLAFDVRHHHVQLVAVARQRRRGAMSLRAAAAAAVDTIVTKTRHTDDNKTKRRCLSRVSEWPRKPKESL